MQVRSQFQPQTSCPLLKSNLNPLWWKLCRLNWSASLWENRTPQKHNDRGTKKIYYACYFSVEAFLVHGASVNLIKPSIIVSWWQEQFQNHLLHESWIGPLPSQRQWCHQPEALSLVCLEQPYFCKRHPFKKFLQRRPNNKNVLHSVLCFLGVNAWCCPVKHHCLLRAEPSVSEPKTGPWGNRRLESQPLPERLYGKKHHLDHAEDSRWERTHRGRGIRVSGRQEQTIRFYPVGSQDEQHIPYTQDLWSEVKEK